MDSFTYKSNSRLSILRLAVDYCGADGNASEGAVKECSEWLISKHPGLSLPELKEAFAMVANKELGEIDLSAYQGRFSVKIFGEVISSYSEYRNAVLAAIRQAQGAEAQENAAKDAANKNKAFRAQILSDYERLLHRNDTFQAASEIPWIWGKVLQEEGMLQKDGQAWISAKVEVRAKFMEDTAAMIPDFTMSEGTRKEMYFEMSKDADLFPSQLIERAKKLYGQLLIFKNLQPYVRP